jgi:NifU-like protein involved in Fe-S cluster formation
MSLAPAHSLYSRDILRLATVLPHNDSLASPQGTATRRAPVCGSEMAADVLLDDAGLIAALAIRARACALGQASAAIVKEKAVGCDAATLKAVRDGLAHMLNGEQDTVLWPELDVFAYARDYPARHGAILLPFDALIAAMEEVRR